MNQIGGYNPSDVHHQNMATTHAHPPTSGPTLGHYSSYPAPSMMPSQNAYPTTSYQGYPYATAYTPAPLPPTMSNGIMTQAPPLSTMQPAPTNALPNTQNFIGHTMDTTGQVAPPGVKPRVTATLWEDEGTLCFQVEAKGVCVARREDNHMINGTKLLNVAGMTRGRRDGILKSEKTRHVVKIGPMHLKGVWIPFDRALDFANKEKITEQLYPLFVHDIGALLYHPGNPAANRPGAVGSTQAALTQYADRRREQQQRGLGQGPAPPQTPGQAPAYGMVGTVPTPTQSSRPGIERANTFPTPPTSASSVVGVNPQGSPYDQYHQMQPQQPLSIDTGLQNRSIPNTPASTPPGKANHGNATYTPSQSYDDQRPVYSNVAQPGPYQPSRVQFGGPLPPAPYKKEEGEHTQDYSHQTPYVASHAQYSYPQSQHTAASPHQNGSGRITPRGTAPQGIYQSGYAAPQRSNTAPAYNAIDQRDGQSVTAEPHYYQPSNGAGTKRGREDDDEVDDVSKRQRNDAEDGGPVGGSPYTAINTNRPTIPARKAR